MNAGSPVSPRNWERKAPLAKGAHRTGGRPATPVAENSPACSGTEGAFTVNLTIILRLVALVLALALGHSTYGDEVQYVEAGDSATKGLVLEYHSFPDSTGLLRCAWIRSICVTKRGIYIANCAEWDEPYEEGLTFYDPTTRHYTHFWGKCGHEPPPDYEPNTPLPCNYVRRAVWDGNRLWVVTGGSGPYAISPPHDPNLGLFTFDGKEWQDMGRNAIDVTMIGNEMFVQAYYGAWSGKLFWDIFRIDICDLASKKFRKFEDLDYLEKQGISGPLHITGDSTKLFFVGYGSFPARYGRERRAVLYSYDRRKSKWHRIEGLGARRVMNIYWDGSYLWVCGHYEGVEKYDPKTGTWSHSLLGSEFTGGRTTLRVANCLVKYGQYLIAGFEGLPLGILDMETGAVCTVDNPKWISGKYVRELALDGNTLWIGTMGNNGGLTRLDLRVLMQIAFNE